MTTCLPTISLQTCMRASRLRPYLLFSRLFVVISVVFLASHIIVIINNTSDMLNTALTLVYTFLPLLLVVYQQLP